MLPEPITRLEQFLYAIITETPLPEPITRLENILAHSYGNGTTNALTPITRLEILASGKLPGKAPITRIEQFWWPVVLGERAEVPTPVTRLEHYFAEWVSTLPQYETRTVSGALPITLENVAPIAQPIVSFVEYGAVNKADNGILTSTTGALEGKTNGDVVGGSAKYTIMQGTGDAGTATIASNAYVAKINEEFYDERDALTDKITRRCRAISIVGSEDWGISGTKHYLDLFYQPLTKAYPMLSAKYDAAPILSTAKQTIDNMPDKSVVMAPRPMSPLTSIIIRDDAYTTNEEWKAMLAEQSTTKRVYIYPLLSPEVDGQESFITDVNAAISQDGIRTIEIYGDVQVQTPNVSITYKALSGGGTSPIVGTGIVGSAVI